MWIKKNKAGNYHSFRKLYNIYKYKYLLNIKSKQRQFDFFMLICPCSQIKLPPKKSHIKKNYFEN